MDLKYFWIKEQLDKGLLRLDYLDTNSMAADFVASRRTGSSFRHFRSMIMGEGTYTFNVLLPSRSVLRNIHIVTYIV